MWLIGIERDGERRRVEVSKTEIAIGRAEGNTVVLDDVAVDLRHLRIVIKDGRYIVVDLRSDRGTYLEGRRIAAPQVFEEGDRLSVGPFELWIEERSLDVFKGSRPPDDRELELLELVARDLDSDEPRLVYADYLMDRGDPRGEFISLQIELAHAEADDASALEIRLRDLADRVGDSALRRLIKNGVRFERGFVALGFAVSPFRRETMGTRGFRVSPAICEVKGRLPSMGTRLRATRSTPGTQQDVALIAHDNNSMNEVLNHAYLRRLLDSTRVGACHGAVELRNRRRPPVASVIEWPIGPTWDERFRRETTFTVADIAHAGAALSRAVADVHACQLDGKDAGLRLGTIDGGGVVASPRGWLIVDTPALVAAEGIAPHPHDAWEVEPRDNVAPETLSMGTVNAASDIYCVGALVKAAIDILRSHSATDPDPSTPLGALEAATNTALAPDPDNRFNTATALAAAYEALLG